MRHVLFFYLDKPTIPLTGLIDLSEDEALALRHALNEIPQHEAIVLLRRLDGWKFKDIARNYNVTTERIRNLYARSMRHIQGKIRFYQLVNP